LFPGQDSEESVLSKREGKREGEVTGYWRKLHSEELLYSSPSTMICLGKVDNGNRKR